MSIELEAVDGPAYILRLEGLDRLLCDGFAEGNIISHIVIHRGSAPQPGSVRRLCGELHPGVKEPHRTRHEQWIESVIERISTGEQTFIEIVPSCGA